MFDNLNAFFYQLLFLTSSCRDCIYSTLIGLEQITRTFCKSLRISRSCNISVHYTVHGCVKVMSNERTAVLLVGAAHGLRERAAAVGARGELAARELVRTLRLLVRTRLVALSCRHLYDGGLLRWHNCDDRSARLSLRWLLVLFLGCVGAQTLVRLNVAHVSVRAYAFAVYVQYTVLLLLMFANNYTSILIVLY